MNKELQTWDPYQDQRLINIESNGSGVTIRSGDVEVGWNTLVILGLKVNEGLPRKAIALRIGISTDSVNQRLAALRQKYSDGDQVPTLMEAVVKLEIAGLLFPPTLRILAHIIDNPSTARLD